MRIELTTSSLPRKCSTPELQQLDKKVLSGRPGSNRPPEAWKATALPNELLPLIYDMQICYAQKCRCKRTCNLHTCMLQISKLICGQSRVRTYVLAREQIYSLSPLTTRPSAQLLSQWRDSNPRPADYKSAALAN